MADSPEAKTWNPQSIWDKLVESVQSDVTKIQKEAGKPRRQKLPGTRSGQIVKFEIAGSLDGFIVVGVYEDGRCGEVFGRLGQGGSFAHGMFESFCKAFSVMLQWGVPLEKAIGSFKNLAFDPAGFAKVAEGSTDADIKSCKSVVDLMMRILEWLFPSENGYKLRTYQQQRVEFDNGVAEVLHHEDDMSVDEAKDLTKKLGAAEMCPECHGLSVIQDGKCKRCTNCGFSSGGCGG
jgi:ribonucleoside-diphosphate reductase alpha chain